MSEIKIGEMKIGEIRAFKCEGKNKDEDNPCEGCMFHDEMDCWVDTDITGHCEKAFRDDKKDVIFVRTDSNEIIRERIEKQIDRLSGGDDDKMIALSSHAKECKIGFKAGYWKRLLLELLQIEELSKGAMNDEVQSGLQDS